MHPFQIPSGLLACAGVGNYSLPLNSSLNFQMPSNFTPFVPGALPSRFQCPSSLTGSPLLPYSPSFPLNPTPSPSPSLSAFASHSSSHSPSPKPLVRDTPPADEDF